MRYPDANVANIAIVAIIGVIGGQALALAFLAIIQDSAIFGWEGGATALLDGVIESAGAVAGICLVGFRFRVVGFRAVRAVGGIGLAGAALSVMLSLITESTRYGVTEPLAFLFIRPALLFAIFAAAGAIAALAATAVAAMINAICSTDMRLLDAERRNAVLFIIAALSLLATESATWSISPNRIQGLLTNVLNLAYVLIGVGALGAWLRVLSARVIGPAALLTVLASLLLTIMSLALVSDNNQALTAGLLRLLMYRVVHAAGGALAAGVAVAIVARARRVRAVAQEQPDETPNDHV